MKVNIQDAIHCVNVDLEGTTCENCRLFGLDYSMCAEVDKIKLEALEKQIPKKPKTEPFYGGRCIVCNALIPNKSVNYCHDCGQKLDWSD